MHHKSGSQQKNQESSPQHRLPELLACFPRSWFSWEASPADLVPGQHDLPQPGPSSHAWVMWCRPVGLWERAGHQKQFAEEVGLGAGAPRKSLLWPRSHCAWAVIPRQSAQVLVIQPFLTTGSYPDRQGSALLTPHFLLGTEEPALTSPLPQHLGSR